MTYATDPYAVAAQSDALIILTEWKEFASLDLHKLRSLLKYPIVIDGRNLYDPKRMAEAGLMYHSIGRAPSGPEHLPAIAHEPEVRIPLSQVEQMPSLAAQA